MISLLLTALALGLIFMFIPYLVIIFLKACIYLAIPVFLVWWIVSLIRGR
jgi:hypothetical protein